VAARIATNCGAPISRGRGGGWRLAGVPLVYQFINGDLNSSSASSYEWGVRHHTGHRVGSGYIP